MVLDLKRVFKRVIHHPGGRAPLVDLQPGRTALTRTGIEGRGTGSPSLRLLPSEERLVELEADLEIESVVRGPLRGEIPVAEAEDVVTGRNPQIPSHEDSYFSAQPVLSVLERLREAGAPDDPDVDALGHVERAAEAHEVRVVGEVDSQGLTRDDLAGPDPSQDQLRSRLVAQVAPEDVRGPSGLGIRGIGVGVAVVPVLIASQRVPSILVRLSPRDADPRALERAAFAERGIEGGIG